MADRIITINITDIVSGESVTFTYNADTKELTIDPNSAMKVEVLSDAQVSKI
jgi:hypothetical protein